ncbi:10604_t:CDS:2 [Entrophospora sp. SA101]|nr:10604_t:CDS:2 [Entrophospora sp. SA101]CAJ0823581.1 9555_t:CDS:2 [Entrophospora sp. SA101]
MKNITGENYNDENNDITASTSNIIPKDTTNDVNYDITDLRSFSLRELLISSNVEPSEVWVLKHYFGRRKQYVIVFNDGAYLCTCMLLSHEGIVCRHFLAILRTSQIAKFHISMVSKRCDLIKVLNSNLPKTQDKVVDTKKNYIKLLDSFKSITQIIGDDPDKYEETKTLFEETYHKLKREKEEKEEREEKEIIDNDDNKIKNPIPTKTKGHPKKGSNSKKNITKTNNSKKN